MGLLEELLDRLLGDGIILFRPRLSDIDLRLCRRGDREYRLGDRECLRGERECLRGERECRLGDLDLRFGDLDLDLRFGE